MVKKKKNTVKKKKAKKAAPKKVGKLPVTKFMLDFRLFLCNDKPVVGTTIPWAWPPAGQLPTTSFADITDVVTMLGAAYVTSTPPPPGSPATFIGQAATRVNKFPWPTSSDYRTSRYGWPTATINLFEIDRIVDMMLQAINASGGGGGPHWPPVK